MNYNDLLSCAAYGGIKLKGVGGISVEVACSWLTEEQSRTVTVIAAGIGRRRNGGSAGRVDSLRDSRRKCTMVQTIWKLDSPTEVLDLDTNIQV